MSVLAAARAERAARARAAEERTMFITVVRGSSLRVYCERVDLRVRVLGSHVW